MTAVAKQSNIHDDHDLPGTWLLTVTCLHDGPLQQWLLRTDPAVKPDADLLWPKCDVLK